MRLTKVSCENKNMCILKKSYVINQIKTKLYACSCSPNLSRVE